MTENWREEYKKLRVLTPLQERVLEEGATSLATAHILNALHLDYDRLKGIQDLSLIHISEPTRPY